MEQEFHHGDTINLLMNQEVVAIGKVQVTQPSNTCHENMLGLGLLLVTIEIYLNDVANFPFPTNDACKVSEAICEFVK